MEHAYVGQDSCIKKTSAAHNSVRKNASLKTTLYLFLCSALTLFCLQPLWAAPANPGGFAGDPDLALAEDGGNWQLIEKGDFSAGASVGDPANERFVVFPANAIDEVEAAGLLPMAEAQEIRDELDAEGTPYTRVEDTFIIHLEAAEAKAGEGEGGEMLTQPGSPFAKSHAKDCWGWQSPETSAHDWSWNHPGQFNLFNVENDYFNGTIDANFPVDAQVDASVTYKVKKAFCVPYKFRLIEATIEGFADLDGSISADAELKYTSGDDWNWKKKIHTFHLGSLVVNIGPVPVYLQFKLPITVGLDTEVEINGEAHLKANIDARADFNVTCTSSNCTGTSGFTRSFEMEDPQLQLQMKAETKLWAKVAVRMDVYDESIANASVAAKAYAKAHLFGYYGNMCGDADGNGANEYVSALLLDTDVGWEVRAELGGALLPDKDWKLVGGSYHLGFWDLLGSGGSSVLTPMIEGPENPDPNTQVTYTFKTRPCYPYKDKVDMSWNGPVTGSGEVEPTDGTQSDTETIAEGTHLQKAYPLSDSHGRTFGAGYTTEMDVYAGVVPAKVASAYDAFARSMVVGDFDCDGYDDLAVGVPYEDVDEVTDAGLVTVVYGDREGNGMPTVQGGHVQQIMSRDELEMMPMNARFGWSLAVGDFDGDSCQDLAVGAPYDYQNEGIVQVLYGAQDRSTSLKARRFLYMDQAQVPSTGAPLDYFGQHLAAGDVDGDGYDDLAITVPGFDAKAGAVALIYGLDTPIGPSPKNELIHQDSPGVPDSNEDNDGTRMSVAIGDFNDDGFGDLVIGYPYEDKVTNLTDDGMVIVFNGTASGPVGAMSQHFGQSDLVANGGGTAAESSDRFGFSLAVGDWNGDSIDDLAVGSPYEHWGSAADTGVVQQIFGSAGGLQTDNGVKYNTQAHWAQQNADYAYFGYTLQAGDFDGDGFDDLAMGAWGAKLFVDPSPGLISYAGQVHVGYGQAIGLLRRPGTSSDTEGYLFSRLTPGVDGPKQSYTYTGYSLGAGDFDGDGNDDLAIGSFGSKIDGKARAGSANVLYGSPSLITGIGSVHLHQD